MVEFNDGYLTSLLPPDDIIGNPGGDRSNFLSIGKFYVDLFYDKGLFNQNSTVLDIGCSVGRMAIPMTQLLTNGLYEGFDSVQRSIAWCTACLSDKFPHFSFTHLDVRNSYYNANGTIQGDNVRFPYEDETFDFVWANSVFTHMGDIGCFSNYVHETSRVLKSGGRFFSTFFLLDYYKPVSAIQFPHCMGPNMAVLNPEVPDIVASFFMCLVNLSFLENGLTIDETIKGHWSDGVYVEPFQDCFIATKK